MVDFFGGGDLAAGMILGPDDKILVSASASHDEGLLVALLFNPGGSLDQSFNALGERPGLTTEKLGENTRKALNLNKNGYHLTQPQAATHYVCIFYVAFPMKAAYMFLIG